MGIEHHFQEYVEQWQAHCASDYVRVRSTPYAYTDCDAYHNIVALGPSILPLVRSYYGGCDEHAFFPIFGWADVISAVVGPQFKVPEHHWGNVRAIRDYSVSWLDTYLEKQS